MNPCLIQALRERRLVLFVGAGVSQNLALPSFKHLVRHLACHLSFDPDVFETHGDYQTLAEYYTLQGRPMEELCSLLNKDWHEGRDISTSPIHKLLVDLDFPIIYTTNFDTWIERAFDHYGKDHHKIVNVGDLARKTESSTQIIKFHGDLEDHSSIVLSEASYFERLSFESPLDIKLRADLLGRSVLFIGYSFQDMNLRLMLYRLVAQWRGFEASRPQLFIFLTRPNPVLEAVLVNRGVEPIVSDSDDPGEGLRQFLEQLLQETAGQAS